MKLLVEQKDLYLQVYEWVKRPHDTRLDAKFLRKLRISTSLVTFSLVFSMVVLLPLIYLMSEFVVTPQPALEVITRNELIVFVIIIAPLLEEFTLRFFLPYRRNYLARVLNKISKGWVVRHWSLIFKFLVFGSAGIFGMIHLSNYDNVSLSLILFSPLLLSSQLIGGLTLAYTRTRLGIWWAVGEHAVFNAILVATLLLFSHNSSVIRVQTDEYRLDVRRLEYVSAEASKLDYRIEGDNVYMISAEDYNLQSALDQLGLGELKLKENFWADLKFESTEGLELEELQAQLSKSLN